VFQSDVVCCKYIDAVDRGNQVFSVCCSLLQSVAECCSVLQLGGHSHEPSRGCEVCCSVLQCVAVCCSVLQCSAVCCSVLQCVAAWCSHELSGCSQVSNMCVCVSYTYMGWLRLVGSLKLQVSFAKEPYKRDDILQKRPIILSSLLMVATPYQCVAVCCSIMQRVVVRVSVSYTYMYM